MAAIDSISLTRTCVSSCIFAEIISCYININRKLLHVSKAVPRKYAKYENIRRVRVHSFSGSREIYSSLSSLLLKDVVFESEILRLLHLDLIRMRFAQKHQFYSYKRKENDGSLLFSLNRIRIKWITLFYKNSGHMFYLGIKWNCAALLLLLLRF